MRNRPYTRGLRWCALGAFALTLALPTAALASPVKLESKQYGAEWPFPHHPTALLDCEVKSFGGTRRPLVIIKLGGTWYGLNGAAMGVGGFPDARSQMARHPEWGYYELGASDKFIQKGLKICGWE